MRLPNFLEALLKPSVPADDFVWNDSESYKRENPETQFNNIQSERVLDRQKGNVTESTIDSTSDRVDEKVNFQERLAALEKRITII